MDPNFRPRKKQNKKNLMPSDFEGPPVAGPSNAITRVAPDPAPTIPLESPDLPNMTAGLWSGALYHMPHNFTPRSVDEIPIDPSLRMNEPSISPAPIPRRDPYVFMERPSVHGPPLAPPAPPGRCARFLYRTDAKPFDSPNTVQYRRPFGCLSISQPPSHFFTRYCLNK